ncbi:CGLD27 family protein, partial [Merismopedia glauca]
DCPVPLEQQPIQQYEELQNSCFSGWAKLELPKYLRNLGWVWLIGSLLVSPVAASSFTPSKYWGEFLLSSVIGGEILLGLLLLRLYLGWFYVRNRLYQETIVYEESGWYDGQSWTKTSEILTRDRLIATYEIQPILQRLQQTGLWLAMFLIVGMGILIAI